MRSTEPRRRRDPEDRSVRRTWWLLSGTFLVLAAISGVRALTSSEPFAWASIVVVAIAAIAAIAHRNAVVNLEVRGRVEAENFAGILRGLSRSVSVDAIVGAIVDDLAEGTGADHVVVARRQAESGPLEATLVTRRAGVPNSTTVLPLGDLDLTFTASPSLVPVPMGPDLGSPVVGTAAGQNPVVGTAAGRNPDVGTAAGRNPDVGTAAGRNPVVGAAGRNPAADPGSGPRSTRAARADTTQLKPSASGLRLGPPVERPGIPTPLSRAGAWASELMEDFGLARVSAERGVVRSARAEVLGSGASALAAGRIAERVRAVYGLSHTLAAPLQTDDGVIGAIVVSRRDREAWDVPARRLLSAAAVEASAAFARAYSFREATANASTDPLTGLPNRRYFDEFCGLLARRRRAGDAVAVLMVDIDRFKVLNDTYGHPVGDVVLQAVARAIVSAVREEDVPARVGGEEFAVLLRNPGPEVALEVGQRVCAAVRALDLSEHRVRGVSVSVGVANARGADEPIPAIIGRADQALLRAKREGRDRVIAA
ncbi:MAG: diguanylate cyclase [Chloroflexi bacterium]|nr:diguanylate cyclase [Chloroflexota bacterium]